MPFLICPECGEHNPLEAEVCQVCQASLADVVPSEEPVTPEPEGEDFDLFNADEADLPDLLESLKQDSLPMEAEPLPGIDLNDDSEEPSPEGESSEGEGTPNWLEVVRKRAQKEEDAVGDLSKRINDAQENLKQEKRESQHEDFESWIQKLREEARDKAAGEPIPEEEESPPEEAVEEDEPKWLSRIRKVHGGTEEKTNEPDAAGRSLLEWLVELEEQRTAEESSQETEVTQQVSLPPVVSEPDATREIRISSTQQGKQRATLNLTREDREQADQLVATIADETADRPVESRSFRKPLRLMNIFFSILLLGAVAFMLLTGRVVSFRDPVLPPAGQALMDWTNNLAEDANILLVFDYQPAYAAEMARVAGPILSELFGSIDAVDVISSSPTGTLLSAEMLAGYEGLTITDMGYIPGEALAAYGFAGAAGTDSMTLSQMLDQGGYTGVLVLSGQFESAQAWVEQWHAIAPETLLNLLVTAQAGPLLQPYVESGQINGMVSGLTEAVAVEAYLGQKGAATAVWQAYQVGILVMIGGLAFGAIAGSASFPYKNKRGER